ncbi:MAG: VWA domain-containing protein [Pyrinomonadaceae bacterium]
MKISAKLFFVFLIGLLFGSPVFAQQPDDDVVKVDTSFVRLNVGVVNAQGRPITNLNQQNFTVYEDDVKQNIARFEPTAAPFSLVLLLDVSGSTKPIRQLISQTAARFIDALPPETRIAVITFNDKTDVLTDFTVERKKVFYAVSLIESQKKGGDTMLYKALDFSLDKLKNEGKRRKAIVVLTDGIDTELEADDRRTVTMAKAETAQTAVAAVQPEQNSKLIRVLNNADKEEVTIYPLALPSGDPARIPDPLPFQVAKYTAARDRLQILANRTGGTMNAINRLEDTGKLYASVAAELGALYSVEYQSSNEPKRSGKWRAIRIEVNSPELIVKTRPGYYAK